MIAMLRGKIVELEFTKCVMDVNGVGYEVFIPMSTYDRVCSATGDVVLRILTVVREDSINLYGFSLSEEKQLFVLLNTVSGIGPKLALNILSAMPVEHICALIANSEIVALTKISGLGKKTAERLTVELRDKVHSVSPSAPYASAEGGSETVPVQAEDAIGALCTLGYKDATARKAVTALLKKLPVDEQSAENLIRSALQKLNS